MFKQLALVLGGLLGIALLVSFVLPGHWEVARDMQINADTYDVHRVVGELETWNDWSPWGRGVDTSAQVSVGPEGSVVGGRYEWKGKQIGSGHVKIVSTSDEQGLTFELGLRGGAERVQGTLRYEPAPGGGTRVRFTLRGDVSGSPVGRYIALMRGYTTGPDLVDALTRLKRRIERGV
jgi:uncharacterized membrane protein